MHSFYPFKSSLNFKPHVNVSLIIKSHIYNSWHKPHKHAFIDKYDTDSNEISCFNKTQYKDYMFYFTSNWVNHTKVKHNKSCKENISIQFVTNSTTRVRPKRMIAYDVLWNSTKNIAIRPLPTTGTISTIGQDLLWIFLLFLDFILKVLTIVEMDFTLYRERVFLSGRLEGSLVRI